MQYDEWTPGRAAIIERMRGVSGREAGGRAVHSDAVLGGPELVRRRALVRSRVIDGWYWLGKLEEKGITRSLDRQLCDAPNRSDRLLRLTLHDPTCSARLNRHTHVHLLYAHSSGG